MLIVGFFVDVCVFNGSIVLVKVDVKSFVDDNDEEIRGYGECG